MVTVFSRLIALWSPLLFDLLKELSLPPLLDTDDEDLLSLSLSLPLSLSLSEEEEDEVEEEEEDELLLEELLLSLPLDDPLLLLLLLDDELLLDEVLLELESDEEEEEVLTLSILSLLFRLDASATAMLLAAAISLSLIPCFKRFSISSGGKSRLNFGFSWMVALLDALCT